MVRSVPPFAQVSAGTGEGKGDRNRQAPMAQQQPESGRWTSLSFPATDDAAAKARKALDALLGFTVSGPVADDVRLLVSELVTNAVKHSGTDEVCLTVRPGDPLRVGVRDNGYGHPHVRTDDGLGGYGLQLVALLSSQWGVEDLPAGKVVWFDVPLQLD